MHVTVGEVRMRLSENSIRKCEALSSSQEQVATRMIFYAVHCSQFGYSLVVIISDVF